MRESRRSTTRLLGLALVAVLGVLIVGDRTRAQSTGEPVGIDPLAVLDLQVKPVAVIVVDSSNSMLFPLHSNYYLASDDPNSRMVLAKKALRDVITGNQGKVRFKLARYNDEDNGVFVANNFNNLQTASDPQPGYLYVTTDPNGSLFNTAATGDRWFSDTMAVWTDEGEPVYVDPDATPRVQQTRTYYYLASLTYLNGQTLNSTGAVTDPGTPKAIPEVYMSNTTTTVTYKFVGVRWAKTDGCNATGYKSLTNVASCGDVDQITDIDPYLGREVQISSAGALDTASAHGIRSAASTPIGATLTGIKSWFDGTADGTRAETPRPRTFVIVLTDGDDNCSSGGAAGAAAEAQDLYDHSTTNPLNHVETLVIAFGPQASQDNANKIAWAGAGMQRSNWSTTPTAAELAVGCNGGPCRNAFMAADLAELKAALQAALDHGTSSGQFAASPTTADTVWELGWDAGVNPWKPFERYHAFVSIVFQPTFDASNFAGKLTAWGYSATGAVAKWEAGAILSSPTVGGRTGASGLAFPSATFAYSAATFSGLRGSDNTLATALIKRRIYTSSSNGAFTTAAAQQPAALWPPPTSVAPDNSDTAAGTFDAALGIAGLDFTALQASPTVACRGVTSTSHWGHPCLNGTTRLDRARREAREMILAHMAGAEMVGRCASSTSATYVYNTAGPCVGLTASDVNSTSATDTGIVYGKRWPLAESTNATPAVVGPPPEVLPKSYETPYKALRTALRHPDKVSDQTVWADSTKKPVMTVVYLATNAMLHAFRAGPCPNKAATDPYRCEDGKVNKGGEELWGFVPFDQLGKLRELLAPPVRKPHTYMMAASLRVADVYDPDTSTWRTLLFAGRGIGGKHITALDITNPGRATLSALSASINPPLVMWNRGNPDTTSGVAGGPWNNSAEDGAAYAKMGQTWSVPAVVKVDPAQNTTTRRSAGVSFVAYAGSGYSGVSSEGSTFYALDALNGDVVGSYDVADGSDDWFAENAIVAPPAVLQPAMYSTEVFAHPSDAAAARVYVGDLHGRVWAFPPKGGGAFAPLGGGAFAALGANQPIANGVALLHYATDGTVRPHVYVASGNDDRVTPPGDTPPFETTPPFRMYGLRDEDLTSDPSGSDGVSGPARVLFAVDYRNQPPPGFRGTVQPVSSFNAARQGRVFFAGTQFTPAGTECISSYDSILYMLSGRDGQPAYDVNDGNQDAYVVFEDQLVNQLDITRVPPESGRLNVSRGMGTNGAAPKPVTPPKGSRVAPAIRSDVYWTDVRLTSSVCR